MKRVFILALTLLVNLTSMGKSIFHFLKKMHIGQFLNIIKTWACGIRMFIQLPVILQ